MKKIIYLSIASLIFVFVVSGCEKTEDDNIASAQACLNKLTDPSGAAVCKAMISGINNERANRIRCFLEMAENGVTESTMINAYKAIDNGGEDPVIEVGTGMGLPINNSGQPGAPELAAAASIKSICYQTNSGGLKTLAQLVWFGTKAKEVTTGDVGDPHDVATDIGNMADADAGQFAVDVYQLYCVPTFSNEKVCTSLKAAGADDSSNVTQVGQDLKTCLNTNTCR